MAIFHLSTSPLSRAEGRSAVAAAAYRSGEMLYDTRTGQVFDYTKKGGVESAEIVAPAGISAPDRQALWNAAEAAEKRKDSRVAREWRLGLPAELGDEDRRALAVAFGQAVADRYGVAVDVCVHAPDKDGDDRNHHAHLLATTRQIGPDGQLGQKAAIELGNKDRVKAGIPGTTQAEITELRATWARLVNESLERAGHSSRVDHRSYAAQGIDLTPTTHMGVHAVAMSRRGLDAERVAEHAEIRQENADKIEANPAVILDKITRTQAVFDRRDIARELHQHIDDPEQFQRIMVKLETAPDLVQLAPESQEGRRIIPARYSTREMIHVERAMVDTAERMAESRSHGVSEARQAAAMRQRDTLSEEQRAAVAHVTGAGQLAVLVGDAGTGKSFTMATARDAWEAEGLHVRGCALSGKAADELQAGSGIESRTIHSMEAAWKRGKDALTERDVLVVDEAGMVGSRQLGRLLAAADQAGAKVVLLGDAKQLAAIEAGAAFRAVTERVGATEITEIRRQREDWARGASREFARGDVATGLDAYRQRGHVRQVESREAAKAALAADWLADRKAGKSSIILAHSNKDVASLNESIRTARTAAGELGPGADYRTERGTRNFAAGDRLVFLENSQALGVKNGTLGTVEAAEAGRLLVKLDGGAQVQVDQDHYGKLDHGYAVTIHKAQGVTVDRAHVLATPGMDRSLAYVAMTRHREDATLYAGGDDFGSYEKLARGLARQRPKESTLDFAERRGMDGGSVMGQMIERGRERLAQLGTLAREALGKAMERAGLSEKPPALADTTPAHLAGIAATAAGGRQSAQDDAYAARKAELAGGRATPQADPLAQYAAAVDRAKGNGDPLLTGVAERGHDLAKEALASGQNPAHLFQKIHQQAMQEMRDHLRVGGDPTHLADAMKNPHRAASERPSQGEATAQEQTPEQKRRAELQWAMNRTRDNTRGPKR